MPRGPSEEKQLKWKQIIEQQHQSGLSIDKWCRQNQIHPHTFYYWRDKLFPKQLQKSSFSELNLKCSTFIKLQAEGIEIQIGAGCNPKLRRQIFAVFVDL